MFTVSDSLNPTYYDRYVRDQGCVPVVIYTMGKVGSTSIANSLGNQNIHPVFHLHKLRPENIIARQKAELIPKYGYESAKVERDLYGDIILTRKPAHFITAVRDPLGRSISNFFQILHHYVDRPDLLRACDFARLQDIFFKNYPCCIDFEWFDLELYPVLGIDVYSIGFPANQGRQTYVNDNFKLLVLKLETADAVKEKGIMDFLELPSFTLSRDNESNSKEYFEVYDYFRNNVSFSHAFIDKVYSSRHVKHFYSQDEIEILKDTWKARGGAVRHDPADFKFYHEHFEAAINPMNGWQRDADLGKERA